MTEETCTKQGTLLHIHTAARSGRPMLSLESALAVVEQGIAGDRYAAGLGRYSRSPGLREITLFEVETIQALREELKVDLQPHEHRRNLTTEGIALDDLVGTTFSVGEVVLEGLGPCRPCRYLNMMSKKQIFTKLADRAGLFCRVVSGGTLHVGDRIVPTG
ncbi:MAG: MOSC domain-containing protein [Rhizobiaceae bacterium]